MGFFLVGWLWVFFGWLFFGLLVCFLFVCFCQALGYAVTDHSIIRGSTDFPHNASEGFNNNMIAIILASSLGMSR